MSNNTEKLFIGGWMAMIAVIGVGVVAETYCNLKNNKRQQRLADLQAKALEYTNEAYEGLNKEKG